MFRNSTITDANFGGPGNCLEHKRNRSAVAAGPDHKFPYFARVRGDEKHFLDNQGQNYVKQIQRGPAVREPAVLRETVFFEQSAGI